MPRQSTSQLPRRHEEGFTIPLKSRGARIATTDVDARSSCEIVHIDVVHLASPDFASLLSSLGHEHAMQATCRIAKCLRLWSCAASRSGRDRYFRCAPPAKTALGAPNRRKFGKGRSRARQKMTYLSNGKAPTAITAIAAQTSTADATRLRIAAVRAMSGRSIVRANTAVNGKRATVTII